MSLLSARKQICFIANPVVPELLEIAEAALAAGITMLQLRGHEVPASELYELARQLQPRCRAHGAIFMVNDRLDVGLAVGADGFQLGKRSLPVQIARQIVGTDYLLGASVHSLQEAQVAIDQGADFLLAGTIFPSPSHPGGEPTSGLELLRAIRQTFPSCTMLAIGGMTAATANQAIESGANGIAVSSAILRANHIQKSVEELRRVIDL